MCKHFSHFLRVNLLQFVEYLQVFFRGGMWETSIVWVLQIITSQHHTMTSPELGFLCMQRSPWITSFGKNSHVNQMCCYFKQYIVNVFKRWPYVICDIPICFDMHLVKCYCLSSWGPKCSIPTPLPSRVVYSTMTTHVRWKRNDFFFNLYLYKSKNKKMENVKNVKD